jgi:hypothetical protein
LGREKSFPIAETLAARGTPFVFLSGYAETDLPATLSNATLLTKPVVLEKLTGVLNRFW